MNSEICTVNPAQGFINALDRNANYHINDKTKSDFGMRNMTAIAKDIGAWHRESIHRVKHPYNPFGLDFHKPSRRPRFTSKHRFAVEPVSKPVLMIVRRCLHGGKGTNSTSIVAHGSLTRHPVTVNGKILNPKFFAE